MVHLVRVGLDLLCALDVEWVVDSPELAEGALEVVVLLCLHLPISHSFAILLACSLSLLTPKNKRRDSFAAQ